MKELIIAIVVLVVVFSGILYYNHTKDLDREKDEEIKEMLLKTDSCVKPYNKEEARLCNELMQEGRYP